MDLRTRYLGLDLSSPLVASAGPLTGDPAAVTTMQDAGAGAVVMPSLFEEEILHEELEVAGALELGAGAHQEATDYFPALHEFRSVADRYLDAVEATVAAVEIPVIASLNASAAGAWAGYAELLENAGAAAVELNLYRVAADPLHSAVEVEAEDLHAIAAAASRLSVPLAVKLSPYYSSFANFAVRALDAGADGLVLFNRFYQPDVDTERVELVTHVELSNPAELRLPLRWIGILRGQLGPGPGLAATSGVHSGLDAAKALLVGADVAMATSALLRHGPSYFATMTGELLAWMAEHEYESVDQLRGSMAQDRAADPSSFERANYVRTLHSWS
jgi:dihydroorotate dehydrogenase (fumarate)